MTDLSSLSKEQLLQLLQQKEAAEQLQSQGIPPRSAAAVAAASPKKESAVGGPCHYRPVRSNQGACTDPAMSEWGFCKKHSRTVQARKACEKWEAENAPPQASPIASPVQAVSQPPPISTGTTRVDLDAELDRLEGEVLEEEDVDAMEQLARANAKKTRPVRSRVQEEISPAKSGGRRAKASRPKAARKPAVRKKVIRPNFWGRFEDTETHIVFDPTTKCAYGVQDATGKVLALTAKHITICERNGWNYNAPEVDYESESEEDYEEVEEVWDSEEEEEVEGSEEGSWDEDEEEGSEEEGSDEYYDEDEGSDEYEEVTDEDEYYDE